MTSYSLRKHIANHLGEAVRSSGSSLTSSWNKHSHQIPWCVRFQAVSKRRKGAAGPQLYVSFKHLHAVGALPKVKWTQLSQWAKQITEQFPRSNLVTGVEARNNGLAIEVSSAVTVKECLQEILTQKETYGSHGEIHEYRLVDEAGVQAIKKNQQLVVEYSSPNIAKPFHAGHLRSTIIGNVIGNLHEKLGHSVTRINYLGNWGTQFGLLGVGYNLYGNESDLKKDPLKHMFDVYVQVNKDASVRDEIKSQARAFFAKMEQGDEEALSFWRKCMKHSIAEYAKVYERLSVSFDHYHGEAQYVEAAQKLLSSLKESGQLSADSQTAVGYLDLSDQVEPSRPGLHANLVKSDGSTLYLTRDIVAAIERYEKYHFDRLLYVVDNSQHWHFEQLILSLQKLGHAWSQRPLSEFHVKFGRVEGMSTRRGEVVFLQDILDEAQDRMKATMLQKSSTKVSSGQDLDQVADHLACSAIVIQDLKQRRQHNYHFSWERMMDFRGDTGVSLQYTHARLYNIEKNCGFDLDPSCDLQLLKEPSAINLVCHLARYDEALHAAMVNLEPCDLVLYLFMLSRLVHVASEELFVKNQPPDLAKARLLLFHCARLVLADGLQILGLKPLSAL